jgi:hypothetical protein
VALQLDGRRHRVREGFAQAAGDRRRQRGRRSRARGTDRGVWAGGPAAWFRAPLDEPLRGRALPRSKTGRGRPVLAALTAVANPT